VGRRVVDTLGRYIAVRRSPAEVHWRDLKQKGLRLIVYLPQPVLFPFIAARGVPMILSQDNDTRMGGTSLVTTLGNYFVRYRMALYVVFAAAVSLSVAWSWNWLTGAEIFRIMASLPCTFMMLMCMKRESCRQPQEAVVAPRDDGVSQ
jgi:hypothetical protein